MAWIDPAQQLAFVEAEAQGVISLARPRFPRRLLTSEHDGQAVEIGDDASVDRFIDGEETGLVGEQLTDRDRLFALRGEFWPVLPPHAVRSRASHGSARWRGSSQPVPWSPSGRSPSCPVPMVRPSACRGYHPRDRRLSHRGDKRSTRRPVRADRAKLSANASRTRLETRLTYPSTRYVAVMAKAPTRLPSPEPVFECKLRQSPGLPAWLLNAKADAAGELANDSRIAVAYRLRSGALFHSTHECELVSCSSWAERAENDSRADRRAAGRSRRGSCRRIRRAVADAE